MENPREQSGRRPKISAILLVPLVFLFACRSERPAESTSTPEIVEPAKPPVDLKWRSSVINIEGATDSQSIEQIVASLRLAHEKLSRNEISQEDFANLANGSRDIRVSGSALYASDGTNRFLITARHVVFDHIKAERRLTEDLNRNSTWPESMRKEMDERARLHAQDTIFQIIFCVPSLDTILAGSNEPVLGRPGFLMNLGAGTAQSRPYSFSEPELDLAVISLDSDIGGKEFADSLEKQGYVPFPLDQISGDVPNVGDSVVAHGYPESVSLLAHRSMPRALLNWQSQSVTLVSSSFGKVSLSHPNLPFFWCDMSVYPGNSGGPVFSDNRLVGIVSAQATIPLDGTPVQVRIPFARITRSSLVIELINRHRKKSAHVF